jgi:spoIIIJ-associated protein
MIKIEAVTLEKAYQDAASTLKCSVTELKLEVVQYPSKGFLGLFKKNAIIVATVDDYKRADKEIKEDVSETKETVSAPSVSKPEEIKEEITQKVINDTIMPESFINDQDDEDEDLTAGINYTADYDDEFDNNDDVAHDIQKIVNEIKKDINILFQLTCFTIDEVEVKVYNENTVLVEFKGEDAALLIGKEGYRYKALSYMIFNWINTKYDVQLRLEIAEFLKNQEESVSRYLVGVCENIDKDGRAQTKILDGVLVQIALHQLRERYPEKYVVIRSTRDGMKYIIVNDYHNN